MAIASVLIDDGYIPIQASTRHQTLALALLTHHDELMKLVDEWP